MRLILRWLITAIALGAAVLIVPGITVEGDAPLYVAATAVILGLVNALVRPLLRLLSCPFILLTLGLFLFVINAFTLWLSAWIARLSSTSPSRSTASCRRCSEGSSSASSRGC